MAKAKEITRTSSGYVSIPKDCYEDTMKYLGKVAIESNTEFIYGKEERIISLKQKTTTITYSDGRSEVIRAYIFDSIDKNNHQGYLLNIVHIFTNLRGRAKFRAIYLSDDTVDELKNYDTTAGKVLYGKT